MPNLAIYRSMPSTSPEWTPSLSPPSLGCTFLFHSMQRGINLLENYPHSPNKATRLENENFLTMPWWGNPPLWKWKFSDLSLIFTVFQILNSKFLFVKQLWGHWKAHNFTSDQNHSGSKCNQLLILIKMKFK